MRKVWVAQKTLKGNGLELVGWQDKFAVGAVSQYGQPRVCVYVIFALICFRSRFFVLLPHPTSRCCRGCGWLGRSYLFPITTGPSFPLKTSILLLVTHHCHGSDQSPDHSDVCAPQSSESKQGSFPLHLVLTSEFHHA